MVNCMTKTNQSGLLFYVRHRKRLGSIVLIQRTPVIVISGLCQKIKSLVHVFRCQSDGIEQNENQILVQPRDLSKYKLAPAVDKIIARTFFGDEYFFEEFIEELGSVG